MPLPLFFTAVFDGIDTIPYSWPVLKTVPWLVLLWILKTYLGGARNTSERNMHSKVVMITGATSGIGASVARNLASRGAQLVILTQHPLDDPFLQDYILDLRASTDNDLITAIQCDLSSLHSIRQFATKWIDNAPPRRLDMIILCASTMTTKGSKVIVSKDGVENNYAINYVANFQLLSILSPAIRAQPPDRDVRILFATCSSYMGGQILEQVPRPSTAPAIETKKSKSNKQNPTLAPKFSPAAAHATSKLSLMTFATAFQKHLTTYARPDKQPNNARVFIIDPGWSRTPGMRRYLTNGTLWGLALYLITWPLWWLILKSPDQGAQTFLYAAMEAEFEKADGGVFLKEVMEAKLFREEVRDEKVQKQLWEGTEKAVEALEKEGAVVRAREKKEREEREKTEEKEKKSQPEEKGEKAAKEKNSQPEKKAGSRRSKKAAASAKNG